ncbi:hypothetical protein GQ53DRAFT_742618, partial [Thozetella sp. PMI_491]
MAEYKTKTFGDASWTWLKEQFYKTRLWWSLYRCNLPLLLFFACAKTWCTVHQLIDSYDDTLFKDFRDLQTSECNAVAVAGTLIATIAIGSMALPSAGQVHWTARAFWFLSLVSGFVSVLHACNLQTMLSKYLRPKSLWPWMNDKRPGNKWNPSGGINCKWKCKLCRKDQKESNPNSCPESCRNRCRNNCRCKNNCPNSCLNNCSNDCLNNRPKDCRLWEMTQWNSNNYECKCECECECDPASGHYFVPDVCAVLIISAPKVMLHYSLLAYTTGLGIYLGFVWKHQLVEEAVGGDNQNIFIFFVASVGICFPMYWFSYIAGSCKNGIYSRNWKDYKCSHVVGITECLRNQIMCFRTQIKCSRDQGKKKAASCCCEKALPECRFEAKGLDGCSSG